MTWKGKRPTQHFIEIIEGLEEEVKRKITKGFQTVIAMSPVMDGSYRGNHRLTINNRDLSFNPDQIDLSGGFTLNQGLSTLAQMKIGDVVYIQNNAPYAVRLENGWSDQNRDMYAVAQMNIRTS